MHAKELLHTLFEDSCKTVDKRVRRTLFEAAETLTRHKQLSIVSLGRTLNRAAKVKHNIKCIDRLFGNRALHEQSPVFYQAIAKRLLKGNRRPAIIIDWSGLTRCGAYHFLRASVAVGGRTLTLYDQTYPLNKYCSDKTHCQFLKTLKKILPEECQPIIITDAGFRNTWFRAVLRMGWDFIGRVRNKTHYREEGQTQWNPIKIVYERARGQAHYIGHVFLAKFNPLKCHFYLMKQKKKHRIKRNLAGKKIQCSVSKKHARRENEPWLIASSLCPEEVSATEVMTYYKKRMQIEEAFRDLKNTRQGFSLRQCRSFRPERLNVALLIATLAMLILWLFGVAAKQHNLHYSFQTNTEKSREVLSNFMMGWQVLMRNNIQFTKKELMIAFDIVVSSANWRLAC